MEAGLHVKEGRQRCAKGWGEAVSSHSLRAFSNAFTISRTEVPRPVPRLYA